MSMPAAIVTGAGTGIGRATALRLAKAGYGVTLIGRRVAPIKKVAEEIRAAGGRALQVPMDITQFEEVGAMVAKTMEAFGRVDVLVNNAGTVKSMPLSQMTPARWQDNLDTNLTAAFYTTRAVWPIMAKQHSASKGTGGVIVNISSMASRDPFPGLGAYGAAKVALNMLTLVTAREGEEAGIRAVGIAPAAVDTPMFRGLVEEKGIDAGVILSPEDVAGMIAEAVSGSLRYCSGETIFVHRRPA